MIVEVISIYLLTGVILYFIGGLHKYQKFSDRLIFLLLHALFWLPVFILMIVEVWRGKCE